MKKMRKLGLLLTLALTLGLFTACSDSNENTEVEATATDNVTTEEAYSFEISTVAGHVSLDTEPMAIAIYDDAIVRLIDELGYDENIVALSKEHISEDLAKYADDFYLDLDAAFDQDDMTVPLVAANPDLIFASDRYSNNYEKMNEVAPLIVLETGPGGNMLEQLEYNTQVIFDLFSSDELVADYTASIYEKIDAITAITSESEYSIGVLEVDDASMRVLDLESTLSDVLGFTVVFIEDEMPKSEETNEKAQESGEATEDKNENGQESSEAGQEKKGKSGAITLEYWLEKDPDIVIIGEREIQNEEDDFKTLEEVEAAVAEGGKVNVSSKWQFELMGEAIKTSTAWTNDRIIVANLNMGLGDKLYLETLIDAIMDALDI